MAKQLPAKHEHIVMCTLSKRQLYLYEEFMSRSSTRSLLTGGNYLGMMNILMQLRKVCNHPDLFEPRPIVSPFLCDPIPYQPGNAFLNLLQPLILANLSPPLLHLWAMDLDALSRECLRSLCPNEELFTSQVLSPSLPIPSSIRALPELIPYIQNMQKQCKENFSLRLHFQYCLNVFRCSKPSLSFDFRVVRALSINSFLDVVMRSRSSPRLALRITPAWYVLIRSLQDVVDSCLTLIEKFVFVLPKASSKGPSLITSKPLFADMVARNTTYYAAREYLRRALLPFYPSYIRQKIYFPDRKLVQFDSGKLQTLCILLRKLKAGGHKCLIFTQMSKMLDILEVFLNLHAHSYVRLDGSTGIDKRQKLMDRFNSDDKLFCFILSTRSGGLGINLTGADCVIFYDSDWNPAMDAQAQDRAHRIGQTREVNIYRLVCESTVEENILVKARQKRHLDFLVMTEGSFSEESLFSSDGLKDLLGGASGNDQTSSSSLIQADTPLSSAAMEAAMAAAEDADDLSHMKGAKAESALIERDFDESVALEDAEDGEEDKEKKKREAREEEMNEEKALELEFASWQASVGPDFKTLESALKPVERYAVRFHTLIEPYYSVHFISEQQRLDELATEQMEGSQIDVEEIEREKELEERRALANGELLSAKIRKDEIPDLRTWFVQERNRF